MRRLAPAGALLAAAWGLAPPAPRGDAWTLVVTGDARGHLSPCGCTKPMTGGARRRAALSRREGERAVRVDLGGFAAGTGLQDRLKAEAEAGILGASGTDVILLTGAESAFGRGEVETLRTLVGGGLVNASLPGFAPGKVAGPFYVGGISETAAAPLGETPAPDALDRVLAAAREAGKRPALLLDGDEAEARRIARARPEFAFVVHRRGGAPPAEPGREGTVLLLTPGDRGMHAARIVWRDGRWSGYAAPAAGADVPDDPLASRLYTAYLGRVEARDLDRLSPRAPSAAFAGSAACLPCHAEAGRVWAGSAHAHALPTLVADGHGRDPECLPCHTVGFDREGGYRSQNETPDLAGVGCESCHGAGSDHAREPSKFRLPKVGEKSCLPCHTSETSPAFDFAKFWPKVRHGGP